MRFLLIGLLAGCAATAQARPAMQRVEAGVPAASAGNALVVFHRPSDYVHKGNVEVYDGTALVGDLTGRQTCYYRCEPGRHVFVAQSEGASVVEANLAAGRTYDIVLDVASGWFGARIKMAPLNKGDKRRALVAQWLAETPVYRVVDGKLKSDLEDRRRERNMEAVHDFTLGEKVDRLAKMGADDHR